MRPRSLFAKVNLPLVAAVALVTTGMASTLPATAANAMTRHRHWHMHVHPRRIYAPYFETYEPGSVFAAAQQSGARFFTLAFVQSAGRRGAAACTATWNGDPKQPVSAGHYLAQIARLRAQGGDAIASFGGYSADQGGTEIADSCRSVSAIAKVYETMITLYGMHRLDMDIEANSLTNTGGIERRNDAIAVVQAWARAHHIPLWIQFTLGVEPIGFDANTLAIIRNAMDNGVRIDSINLMIFDYYLGNEKKPLKMAALGIASADSVHRQLAAIYPFSSSDDIWRHMGLTLLPGIDDYPARTEITSLADTQKLVEFALGKRMDLLSIWAIQRDNGGCPGAIDSNTCSGVKQSPWAFSHLLEPFTSKH